jgi:hypothetical protein
VRDLLFGAKHLFVAPKLQDELLKGGPCCRIWLQLIRCTSQRSLARERMAATNKYLAKSSKSRAAGEATKYRDAFFPLDRQGDWFLIAPGLRPDAGLGLVVDGSSAAVPLLGVLLMRKPEV